MNTNTKRRNRTRPSAVAFVAGLCAFAIPVMGDERGIDYTTTWLGNSFGGGDRWVQNYLEGMHVSPDGTVYLASYWDEASRNFGVYRDGDVVGRMYETHGWGKDGGYDVVANDQYVFIAHAQINEGGHLTGEEYPPEGYTWYGVSRRDLDGRPAPFDGGRGRNEAMLVIQQAEREAHLRGLALDNDSGLLYISDPYGGRIVTVDLEAMEPIGAWEIDGADRLEVDRDGHLWILEPEQSRVVSYTGEGEPLGQKIELHDDAQPTDLGMDPWNDRLLVADAGPAQQVLIYGDITGSPRLLSTFGEEGGMYGGDEPGLAGPRRFANPHGAGVDRDGNLYVGSLPAGGGAVLRTFSPDGEMLWELISLEMVDVADTDPASDGVDVFTTQNRYTLDWSIEEPGEQWTWRSQTINPLKYPLDPRIHESHHNYTGVLFRELDGRPYLVIRGMFMHAVTIYRLEGAIAVPSAKIARSPYTAAGWADVPQPEDSRWIWRDVHGDGQFHEDEFHGADGVTEPECWGWWMDTDGGVWQGHQTMDDPIFYFPLQGIDEYHNPIYTRETKQRFALPEPMNHLLRVEYYPETDTMLLTGHTADRPKTGDEWGQVGSEVLRFDGWMEGNREPTWRAELPYDPEQELYIKAFATAGDLFFAGELRSAIHVHDIHTGERVGRLTPGPEVHGESGWLDFPDAIRAFQREDGEYMVFAEEDMKAKVLIYRFRWPQ